MMMKLRLFIAVFLFLGTLTSAGCSSEQQLKTGQFPDRLEHMEQMTKGFIPRVPGSGGEQKGYQFSAVTDQNRMNQVMERIWDNSQSLGPKYDPKEFDFAKYDYIIVSSKPKSSSVKIRLKSALQTPDGTLRIAIQEIRPDMQTDDFDREIQIYRILKTYNIKNAELANIETIKPNATH
ncbi:hypothetical protein [Effusibacillus consociatus]|uniref:Uncharacterized protein n=1 Tax=Effusibacillus consociatus TaxID=1117041 RepID=A0ABV9Q5W4_9BACL